MTNYAVRVRSHPDDEEGVPLPGTPPCPTAHHALLFALVAMPADVDFVVRGGDGEPVQVEQLFAVTDQCALSLS